ARRHDHPSPRGRARPPPLVPAGGAAAVHRRAAQREGRAGPRRDHEPGRPDAANGDCDLPARRRQTMTSAPLAADMAGTGPVPAKVFRSELNPVDFLHRAAYLYPDKAAVVDAGRRYSYRQLAERAWRLANALRSAGLGKGDRVATLLFNSAPMLEAHF